jgi:hypothetical protein
MTYAERTARPLTEVERILVAHYVADQAGRFYGQRGSMFFGRSDAVRYVTEGFVGKRIVDVDWSILWDAVGAELDAHPEILTAGPLTEAQIQERHAVREAAAAEYDHAAAEAFQAGDYPLAVALVDAAERECPDRGGFRGWDDLRAFVAAKFAEVAG